MDLLDKVAALIVKNPTVTMREITQSLGYSQEKSIYYWLEKAGYRGIREFKDAVFSGVYGLRGQNPGAIGESERRGSGYFMSHIPVRGTLSNYSDTEAEMFISIDRVFAGRAFAVRVDSTEYSPVIELNDLIVIEPGTPIAPGDLFVLRTREKQPACIRRLCSAEPVIAVHPFKSEIFNRENPGQKFRKIGRVSYLFREY